MTSTSDSSPNIILDKFTRQPASDDAIIKTSHASIAYRKQLPPQRTVGTIGPVWQKSTPSKETTGPAQTRPQSETL